jgi:hypothetical protein
MADDAETTGRQPFTSAIPRVAFDDPASPQLFSDAAE